MRTSLRNANWQISVALYWVIYSQGDSVVTIPSVTKVSQAQENAGAMKFKSSSDEIARLDELSQAIH
jgi:diketogulonate reductase-like aldo/keto reductase